MRLPDSPVRFIRTIFDEAGNITGYDVVYRPVVTSDYYTVTVGESGESWDDSISISIDASKVTT
jgi:hypothetical protein